MTREQKIIATFYSDDDTALRIMEAMETVVRVVTGHARDGDERDLISLVVASYQHKGTSASVAVAEAAP